MNNKSPVPRFIIGIESYALNENDIKRIENKHIVGIILFGRNFCSSAQLKQLTTDIKQIRHDLLICVDQEGGRVQRFKDDKFTPLPALYEMVQQDPLPHFNEHVTTLSNELKAHGIDFSFTPVVDLYHPQSRVINNRAFASTPTEVSHLAAIYIDHMHQHHLPSVLKHFPGHGSLLADSHLEKVIDSRLLSEIEQTDLLPFISLINKNKADSIMAGHLFYPMIDQKIASLSYFWLTEYLRQTLQFNGIIFSDDFGMFAASHLNNKQLDNCKQFFSAGGDIALLCNEFDQIDHSLAYFTNQRFQESAQFIQRWQKFQSPAST